MEKPFPSDMKAYRDVLGMKFLKGNGIEIGAGHVPTAFDEDKAKVQYVDYMPIEQLRKQYGLTEAWKAPDVVDDGQRLENFKENSLDFIVANHMLEHTEDPLGVLKNWTVKLRPSRGLIYVTIPDGRNSFDRDRPVTTMDHFLRDHREGPEWSRDSHFVEVASLVNKVPPEKIRSRADELIERDYRIHFHVWDQRTFLEFILMFSSEIHPVLIEHYGRNTNEFIAILRV